MKVKNVFRSLVLPMLFYLMQSCSDPGFIHRQDNSEAFERSLKLSSLRSELSKEVLDSTIEAESNVVNTLQQENKQSTELFAPLNTGLVNHAQQATVSAESTYPGYSVNKINDGDINTTVGPAYSWANNHPAGGTLPESVFLKFSSLKAISMIRIYTSSGHALQNYTIQYRSFTNGPWVTVATVTGNIDLVNSHYFTEVNILEVQVICQQGPINQNIYGRLNEVQLYGPIEPELPPIYTEGNMLVFNSPFDVEQAISYLEYKYDQYSDAFASQYPMLTDDEFADIEEAVGFNDDQPYIDFENQYGIYSLRAMLAAQEDNWLETTAGDETAGVDPDDLYMDEYELRTLVNSDGYVKVGTLYYVFQSDDSYYTYEGGGGGGDDGGGGGGGCTICPVPLPTIKNLRQGDPLPKGVKYYPSEPIVLISSVINPPACKIYEKDRDFKKNNDNTWRFKWKLKASDGPFGGRVKAVTKSYKKKNGRWKKRGATIGAKVYGNLCNGSPVESEYKEKRRRKVKAKIPLTNFAVPNGGLYGYHYHKKVDGLTSVLTW
jgi:hypothetical protein